MKDYRILIIQSSASIIEAMKQMDSVRHKSLLAFDKDKFYSIVTIGDLQRAIIANYDLSTSISEVINVKDKQYAYSSESIEEIKRRMLQIRCEYMPVLDKEGNLVEVYSWYDLFPTVSAEDKRDPINLPVVIMAGGLGTRLKPLTNVLPKPLIPIGDKTILEEILDQFERIGCKNFYLSVNYKSDMIRYYLNHLEHKYCIEYFEEAKPLGTIGSVSLLKGNFSTAFFVSNCDIIIDQDYREVYEYHQKNQNDLTILTAMKSISIPYGVIETGENGVMIGLQEKPEKTYMINTGVYLMNPSCINEIPQGEFFHITHLMERIKQRGGRIGCFPVSEQSWKDMGDWSEYLKVIR